MTAVELPGRPHPTIPTFSSKDDLNELVKLGNDSCILSIPPIVTDKEAIRAIKAGFKKVLLDKPGAVSTTQLVTV